MPTDTEDLAHALADLGQPDAANRVREKGMPTTIYCSQQYYESYSDKLKMYAKVQSTWLIKDEKILMDWYL